MTDQPTDRPTVKGKLHFQKQSTGSAYGDGPDLHEDGLNLHEDGPDLHEDGLNLHEDGLDLHEDGLDLHEDGLDLHEDGLFLSHAIPGLMDTKLITYQTVTFVARVTDGPH